jgi:excisionase family DNA binding protein
VLLRATVLLVLTGAPMCSNAGAERAVVAFVAFMGHIAGMPSSHRTPSGKRPPHVSKAVAAVERTAAARVVSLMSAGSRSRREMVELVNSKGERLKLPNALTEVVYRAAELLADGTPVAVLPEEDMVSTQDAAELLNVSRQYLVRLVDAGELPAVKVGSHRRLRVPDVMAFKESRDAKRSRALDRLSQLTEEVGGYELGVKSR